MCTSDFVFLLKDLAKGTTFAAIHANQERGKILGAISEAIADEFVTDGVVLPHIPLQDIEPNGITFVVNIVDETTANIEITRVVIY